VGAGVGSSTSKVKSLVVEVILESIATMRTENTPPASGVPRIPASPRMSPGASADPGSIPRVTGGTPPEVSIF
ncbi:MAG: hypothetical protein ACK53Y_22750, partial [bacterium]